jgi:tetratricopeptide (TPR) repeat protein
MAPDDPPMKRIMSITRLFRLGIKVAAWATPHIKKWHTERNMNRTEGQRHLDAGNYTEAEKYLTAALAEREHTPSRKFELTLSLAEALSGQNRLAEADATVRQAVAMAVEEKSVPMQSLALHALLDIQLERSDFAEAEGIANMITRLESSQAKPDQARLAKSAHKLGTALLKSNRPGEALQAFQQAATLHEQAFGPNHLETGNSLAELGRVYKQSGNHTEAQKHLRRAWEIHRAASGADSFEAVQDLVHLAGSLEESGDPAGAAAEYERMLALRERQVGADREETAQTQVRLAALYVRAGRSPKARELLSQAIPILERNGGPRYSMALETMACAEEQAGRVEDAKLWRERALAVPVH